MPIALVEARIVADGGRHCCRGGFGGNDPFQGSIGTMGLSLVIPRSGIDIAIDIEEGALGPFAVMPIARVFDVRGMIHIDHLAIGTMRNRTGCIVVCQGNIRQDGRRSIGVVGRQSGRRGYQHGGP